MFHHILVNLPQLIRNRFLRRVIYRRETPLDPVCNFCPEVLEILGKGMDVGKKEFCRRI